MWGHAVAPRRTLVVIDPTRTVQVLGDAQFDDALVSYKEAKFGSTAVDCFRLGLFSVELASRLLGGATKDCVALVVVFDWMRAPEWTAQAAEVADLAQHACRPKLLLTTANFGLTNPPAVADLSSDVDLCQQFLRTQALLLPALLAYSLSGPLDLRPFVQDLLGIQPHEFEEQYVGGTLLIRSDSRAHILAVDPSFDFEAAAQRETKLPSFSSRAPPPPPPQSHADLQEMLVRAVADAGPQNASGAPRVGVELTDDKQVISEFFTKIAQKYK